MVYNKLAALILFLIAFTVISISGYQCSTRVIAPDTQPLPTSPNAGDPTVSIGSTPPFVPTTPPFVPNNLPREPDDTCPRSEIRDLESQYDASIGFLNLRKRSLTDFRLGRSTNFEPSCSRMLLNLDKNTNNNTFSGEMTLVYYGTCLNGQDSACRSSMRTGYSTADAKYNSWTGSRLSDRRFQAIFEDSYGAYILRIERITRRDIADGRVEYVAAGDIYYKMFRVATSYDVDVNRTGDCYNTGAFISAARNAPHRPSIRCWFLKTGPYSCRPNGDLHPRAAASDINIGGNLKCYNLLAQFYDLDVEKAFNDDYRNLRGLN